MNDIGSLGIYCDLCGKEYKLFKIVWSEIEFFTKTSDLEYRYTCKNCRRNIKIDNVLKDEVN